MFIFLLRKVNRSNNLINREMSSVAPRSTIGQSEIQTTRETNDEKNVNHPSRGCRSGWHPVTVQFGSETVSIDYWNLSAPTTAKLFYRTLCLYVCWNDSKSSSFTFFYNIFSVLYNYLLNDCLCFKSFWEQMVGIFVSSRIFSENNVPCVVLICRTKNRKTSM